MLAHTTDDLFPLVYAELRRLAAAYLRRERPGMTLQPTALVHEAYLQLSSGNKPAVWQDRGHFLATAAVSMRQVLALQARRRKTAKRTPGLAAFPMGDGESDPVLWDYDELDQALKGAGQFAIIVEDVDAICAELDQRGVAFLSGPADRDWGMRTVTFADPGGNIWEIAQEIPDTEAS